MQKPSPLPPPRVEIFYEIEVSGEKERRQLPFVVGVLADLVGHPLEPPKRVRDRKFVSIDVDNFDDVIKKVAPRLAFNVDNRLSEDQSDTPRLNVWLEFRRMDDFAPVSVALQIPALRSLLELRSRLNDLQAAIQANERLDELIKQALLYHPWGEDRETRDAALERLVVECRQGRFTAGANGPIESLPELFSDFAEGRLLVANTTDAMLARRIADIDDLVSKQLNEVFHHPEFQRLEASWRGLEYLTRRSAASRMLKVRILCISKREILRDLQMAPESDQSGLFRLIYEEEYGTFGGQPFGALIGDYGFDYGPDDVGLLAQMSNIAAAASAPFIAAAKPAMFNLESFRELPRPRDLEKVFETSAHARWHAFRKSGDARYVGLVLPHVLQRLPYGSDGLAAEGFDFQEDVDGTDPTKYLWGHAVYRFAVRLSEAFSRHGWCASISGMEHGGLVQGLPLPRFLGNDSEALVMCPTEIAISDRRREELRKLGFIPLCWEKQTDRAVFFEAQSCQKPNFYYTDAESFSAAAAAKLEYTFATSRLSHYIRAITRDKGWQFHNRREWERYLNEWLADYVLLDEDADPEVKARYPLSEGRIKVEEASGWPGQFRVSAQLKPNFQLTRPEKAIEELVEAHVKADPLGLR